MIARYIECDSPSCFSRQPLAEFTALRDLPPVGWTVTALPHYEEWYEPSQERHFCSPECMRYYLTLTEENRAAAEAEVTA